MNLHIMRQVIFCQNLVLMRTRDFVSIWKERVKANFFHPPLRPLRGPSISTASPIAPEASNIRPDRDKLSMEGVLLQVENNGLGGISQQLEKNLAELQRQNLLKISKDGGEKSHGPLEKIFVPTAQSTRSVHQHQLLEAQAIRSYFPINLTTNSSNSVRSLWKKFIDSVLTLIKKFRRGINFGKTQIV